jgi:hypothetical protein
LRVTCPTHLILLDSICLIIFGVEIMKRLTVQCPPFFCHFIPVRSKYSEPRSQTPQSMLSRNMRDKFQICTKQLAELWFCVLDAG